MIRPAKEESAIIRAAAAKSVEGNVQAYILNAIRNRISNEAAKGKS